MTGRVREGKLFNFFKRKARERLKNFRFRLPRFVSGFLFKERILRHYCWDYFRSKLYYENIMRYRCKELGKNFMLFGEIPFMEGDGDIHIADNVTMYGKIVMFTSFDVHEDSRITIGKNSVIGFGVQFRVAKQISIGENCMIGSGVRINDTDGHPIHTERTREHTGLTPEDIKPVIIEDDAWIGENATLLKGVTIGRGSIVSTGSVVTKSVPPNKIVMGNPSRVVMWVPSVKPNVEKT